MVSYRITITGGQDVLHRFEALRNDLHQRQQPMERSKAYMRGRWRANFNSNGSIYGSWAALSLNSWRRKTGGGWRPLHLSGALGGNVEGQGAAGTVSATAVDWHFVNKPPSYPLSHQGGYNPHFPQPARIIWDTNGEDEAAVGKIMEQWVDSVVARYF